MEQKNYTCSWFDEMDICVECNDGIEPLRCYYNDCPYTMHPKCQVTWQILSEEESFSRQVCPRCHPETVIYPETNNAHGLSTAKTNHNINDEAGGAPESDMAGMAGEAMEDDEWGGEKTERERAFSR